MPSSAGLAPQKMPGKFICAMCQFSASYDYLGKRPPFCKSIILMEEAYVMKDPFSGKDGSHQPIVLGAHCDVCTRSVCVGQDCSLFYTKRFCLDCVRARRDEFPQEIHQELNKKKAKDTEQQGHG